MEPRRNLSPDPAPDARAEHPGVAAARPFRVALARHEGAPTGDHLDLFIGSAPDGRGAFDPDARTVATWRLDLEAWRDGGLSAGTHRAERLEPHRALYLALDAPRVLDGGRGRVVPLAAWPAAGTVGGTAVELRTADRVLTLAPMIGSRWQLVVAHADEGVAAEAGAGEARRADRGDEAFGNEAFGDEDRGDEDHGAPGAGASG